MYQGDGEIEIIAYICEGYQVNLVQIFETEGGNGGRSWATGPPIGEADHAESGDVLRLTPFQEPRGWYVTDNTLARLEEGTRYTVSFSTVQGNTSTIRFTMDDLERIGQSVWAGKTGSERPISEDEFVEAAQRDCD